MSGRHQELLAQLDRFIKAGEDVHSNVTLAKDRDEINQQADLVVEALNFGMNVHSNSFSGALLWDALLAGTMRFAMGVAQESKNQLIGIMQNMEIPLEGKETVH